METRFYYLNEANKPVGPVDLKTIRKLRDAGIISDSTLVCEETKKEWEPLTAFFPSMEAGDKKKSEFNDTLASLSICKTLPWIPAISVIAGIVATSKLWSDGLFSFICGILAVAVAAMGLKQNAPAAKLSFRLSVAGLAIGGVVVCLGFLGTVASLSGGSKSPEARAIKIVLEKDRKVFEVSKKVSPRDPVEQARFIARAKQEIDTSDCPLPFRAAYQKHINSWNRAIPYIASDTAITAFFEGVLAGHTDDYRILGQSNYQARQAMEQVAESYGEVLLVSTYF